jgi:hypothetical protein
MWWKLTVAAAAIALWLGYSFAQVPTTHAGKGAPSSGCSPVSSSFGTDGTPQAANAGATSVVLPAFSTSFCNDLIVVGVVTNGSTITSVTDSQSHLTFTKRATNAGGANNLDIWTAPASVVLTGDVITVQAGGGSFITAVINAVTFYHVASPFDPNGALPFVNTTGNCSFTTSNANDMLYGFTVQSTSTPDAGWSLLSNITSSTGFLFGEYKIVSTTQSATNAGSTSLVTNIVCDAIQQGP